MRGIMFLAAILIGLGTVMAQVADRMTTVSPAMAKSTLSAARQRSEEHTSELQSRLVNSYAVFCLKKKKNDESCFVHKHS